MSGMEIEPESEPGPETGSPALGRKGRRTLLVVLTCVAWAFAPSFPGMPRDWHSPWIIALAVSTVIPVIIVFLIAFAPKIHQFGRWLDSTFGPDAREP
jgi:hypothetical protein